ncbi:MAG: toprim domain-containing protein [Phycisphaerales bacterium]|nr:toprim domain-containing protein [Phycisphaerales bacterium]
MMFVDPWRRTADCILQRYVRNPDLIRNLLERIGAEHISEDRRGGFRCACPLHHGDNQQAFAVWVDKGYTVWRCHTRCAAKGNLVTLLMRKYRARYDEAVTWLAKIVGITVKGPVMHISVEQLQEESLEMFMRRLGKKREADSPVLFDERWVHQSLSFWREPSAATAFEFLTGPRGKRLPSGEKCKGYPWEFIQKLQIGYVPTKQWLVPNPNAPNEYIGWFNERIAVPWRDWDGRLIGFAGRRLDGLHYNKYQNFPFTRKGSSLYGIWYPHVQAAIRSTRHAVLVEGYSDAWRAWQYGIYNVLAVGGTELVPEQIKLLARLDPDRVTIFLDSDKAGISASRKMADCLGARFGSVRRAFPASGDPDDMADRAAYLSGIENTVR